MKKYYQKRPFDQQGMSAQSFHERVFELPDDTKPPRDAKPVEDSVDLYDWRPVTNNELTSISDGNTANADEKVNQ